MRNERPNRIRITVDDPFLIQYYDIHRNAVLWVNHVKVCGEKKNARKYYYVTAVVSQNAPRNGRGNKELIRIRETECVVLDNLSRVNETKPDR